MTQANKPHTFVNDTNADAEQVNANFDEIYSKYNGHDGSSANIHGVGSSGFASTSYADGKASEAETNSKQYTDTHEEKDNPHSGSASTNHGNESHSEDFTVGNYEIQKNGVDGAGIINFKT